jgi:dipeptide/tripeptide permease
MVKSQLTWKLSKIFWIANIVELFERAAYYGVFIAFVIFLTEIVGFTDREAGWIGRVFAALLYLDLFLMVHWQIKSAFEKFCS